MGIQRHVQSQQAMEMGEVSAALEENVRVLCRCKF